MAELISRPISIEGREIVIIPDLVGPVPVTEQHQYVELVGATNTCPSISVRESDIEEARERFPELPVFGLWQILVHGNLIVYRHSLHVVKINEYDGFYLHCDLGRAEFSGVYEAGFFAADSDFDLNEAQEVQVELEQLKMPPNEAKLAAELQAERRLKTQKSWRNLGMASAWIIMAAFGLDFSFESFYNQEQKELKNKAQLLESLRSGLNQLRTSRLTEVPNDVEVIKAIALVWSKLPNIKSSQRISFDSAELTFRLADEGFDPSTKVNGITSTYHPEGYWQINLMNPRNI